MKEYETLHYDIVSALILDTLKGPYILWGTPCIY
jgi:hypothetical protein